MHPHHLVRAPHEADERQGTIVDATIIHAPSSIKKEEGRRDPEFRLTKTDIQYFLAMKAPIGADVESDLAHHVQGTAANVADVTQVAELLHDEEIGVYEDPGHPMSKSAKIIKKFGRSPLVTVPIQVLINADCSTEPSAKSILQSTDAGQG